METLPYEFKSLEECTPDYIKDHIDSLKPEEAESGGPRRQRSGSKSPKPKVRDQFTGVNKAYTSLKNKEQRNKKQMDGSESHSAGHAAEPGKLKFDIFLKFDLKTRLKICRPEYL